MEAWAVMIHSLRSNSCFNQQRYTEGIGLTLDALPAVEVSAATRERFPQEFDHAGALFNYQASHPSIISMTIARQLTRAPAWSKRMHSLERIHAHHGLGSGWHVCKAPVCSFTYALLCVVWSFAVWILPHPRMLLRMKCRVQRTLHEQQHSGLCTGCS